MNNIEPLLNAIREKKKLTGCEKSIQPIEFIKLKREHELKGRGKNFYGQYLREVNEMRKITSGDG